MMALVLAASMPASTGSFRPVSLQLQLKACHENCDTSGYAKLRCTVLYSRVLELTKYFPWTKGGTQGLTFTISTSTAWQMPVQSALLLASMKKPCWAHVMSPSPCSHIKEEEGNTPCPLAARRD